MMAMMMYTIVGGIFSVILLLLLLQRNVFFLSLALSLSHSKEFEKKKISQKYVLTQAPSTLG